MHPPIDELRAAGAEAHVQRLRDEAERAASRTLYGRIAWRLACWHARRRARVTGRTTPCP